MVEAHSRLLSIDVQSTGYVVIVSCVLQDSGIDDDVVVMTDDYDDEMDDDAVVLPDAHNNSVSQAATC